ncbi:MAG: hypothetical protein HZB38_04720 [Planctomycetes bacterium]|nr:hypothetical protein [Planctomycetota bacterium]
MRSLIWREDKQQHESLAICLRSLLATAGVSRTYDEILAALGLGTLVVAAADREAESWSSLARDGALIEVAAAMGIRLRSLHAAHSAEGLDRAPEFAAHFRDSYAPLIRRANEAGQFVLVWRGWPPPRGLAWGVVTLASADGLAGFAPGHSNEPLPLVGASHEAIVVEAIEPEHHPLPDPAAQVRHVIACMLRQQRQVWHMDRSLTTGSSAYPIAADWLARQEAAGRPLHEMVRSYARTWGPIVAARRSLTKWLKPLLGTFPSAEAAVLRSWVMRLSSGIEALSRTIPVVGTETTLSAQWTQTAIDALRRVQESDAQAATDLAPLVEATNAATASPPVRDKTP